MKRDGPAIEKTPPRFRTTAYDLQFVGRETNGMQLRRVARDWFAFAVDSGLFRVSLDVYLQVTLDAVSSSDSALKRSVVGAKRYYFLQLSRPKRFRMSEEVDCFQPICFPLTVVPVKDIEAISPDDLAP